MTRTTVKLIAFVLGCMVFATYLGFTIGNIRPSHIFGRGTYQLSATFDDVTGLLKDDNVKVAGVVVGKVTQIKVVEGRAFVRFEVRNQVKVPSDSSAAIRWRNLLGQRYVYLYPGTASTVLTKNGHIGQTRSVVDIGELFNRLGPIVKAIAPDKVNTFLDAITAALDGNQVKLRQTLDDLATLTASLAKRDDAIGRLIENVDTVAGTINSRDSEIRTVLDNLVALATTFSQNTDVLNSAVTDLGDFTNNLDVILRNNRTQIDSILGNLTTLTKVIQSKLPQVDSILGALPAASVRLFNASRYGEWLNQTIPCGAVGRTADGKPIATTQTTPSCNPALSPQPPAASANGGPAATAGSGASLSGAQAIAKVLQP
ncbi:MAG: phospholipid/cholesterol/gamma-HCH transport system substrate-binding protein [Acidimicrobiaceae bacterium]|nr:phospholipid/cholesterol/gamma-HCH transport system substrate-binding protein [Acidimicrobiaceae bacterium]